MKIGNLEINTKYPLFLAPMEDITEPSFRFICKQFGADMMYTEFVASEALIRNIDTSLKKLTIMDYERPIGIQLYGHQIEPMVESAIIAAKSQPDVIDLNFGCPVKKIAMRGAGAGMLRDIPKMLEMTKRIVDAVKIPVTVKTRLGWDFENIIIEQLAEQLQDVGIKALTIHARTRSQLYTGSADWTYIGKVKNNQRIKIPIIGNGDIESPQKAKEAFENYGVDAIMIGRAAIGRPYLFNQIKQYLNTGDIISEPAIEEKVELAKNQLLKAIEWKGSPRGIYEMRRQFITYFKGLPNFKDYKLKLITSLDVDEILGIMNQIKENYKNQ